MVPASKPRLSSQELHEKLKAFNIDRKKYPVIVVGIRGYYMDSMGEKGKNDRGIYDDAIFVDTPNLTVSYNANCDPSVFRERIASLVPGVYYAHTFGQHRGKYFALVQRNGEVTVKRDGVDKPESGFFGINIHKGGYKGTFSEGCQTLHPDQWAGFINNVQSEAKRLLGGKWETATIPYVLIEEKEA